MAMDARSADVSESVGVLRIMGFGARRWWRWGSVASYTSWSEPWRPQSPKIRTTPLVFRCSGRVRMRHVCRGRWGEHGAGAGRGVAGGHTYSDWACIEGSGEGKSVWTLFPFHLTLRPRVGPRRLNELWLVDASHLFRWIRYDGTGKTDGRVQVRGRRSVRLRIRRRMLAIVRVCVTSRGFEVRAGGWS